MTASIRRLRELDFLRGVAILLVLFRHQYLFDFTHKMGWVGVDLFFVLSGFLVSGLLFREYKKFGNIRVGLFLIRRGFKIYPIYYLFYLAYLIPILYKSKLEIAGVISDFLFVQNYVYGWGYAFDQSWSLAVEEHFYIGFAFFMLWAISKPKMLTPLSGKPAPIEWLILATMWACLMLRIYSNLALPEFGARNITMTHLRIDSLLAGVLVSFWHHFRPSGFARFFSKNKKLLLVAALILTAFAPMTELTESFFVRTFGFTFLYIAFGIVLSWFLTDKKINPHLDRVFSAPIVEGISRIGYASYSIYIIHGLVNYGFGIFMALLFGGQIAWINFAATTIISIFTGIFITKYVEGFFLRLRDRHYPPRTV